MLTLRELASADAPEISRAFDAQGWHNKTEEQYRRYYEETARGERVVLVAEDEAGLAGYVTIIWACDYPPFRTAGIPEIADFNVYLRCRRRGIGSALLDEAERRIAQRSPVAGIGVGLTPDYGPAHILYVRRGYIPDGRGLWQGGRTLQFGDSAIVNDDLGLYFTKTLPVDERADGPSRSSVAF